MVDVRAIVAALNEAGVEYVVVGGVAAIAAGYPLPTEDIDITPRRELSNLERLATALEGLDAKLRTDTGAVALPVEARMLASAEMWTLTTRLGDLDVVFVPVGTQGYDDLRRDAVEVDVGGDVRAWMSSLRDVIRSKEAARRAKDQAQLPALRRTLELSREREER